MSCLFSTISSGELTIVGWSRFYWNIVAGDPWRKWSIDVVDSSSLLPGSIWSSYWKAWRTCIHKTLSIRVRSSLLDTYSCKWPLPSDITSRNLLFSGGKQATDDIKFSDVGYARRFLGMRYLYQWLFIRLFGRLAFMECAGFATAERKRGQTAPWWMVRGVWKLPSTQR